jgi:hypothetical protein
MKIFKAFLFIALLFLTVYAAATHAAVYLVEGNLIRMGGEMLGAPTQSIRYERNILPEADSKYELGTSTKAWLRANIDEICLTGDSCITAWSAGSGDVTDVGDCTGGACLDGSSDGGTYIRLYDGNSHYTAIVAGDSSANLTFTLPTTDGDNLQVLQTDGNGVLTWVNALTASTTNLTLTGTLWGNVAGTVTGDLVCTDCLNATEIEDIYVFNSGDTMTGHLTMTYASSTGITAENFWGNFIGAVSSDATWTLHNDYPAACSAGQYVSAVGDTLTCGTPTNTTYVAGNGLLLVGTTFSVNAAYANTFTAKQTFNGGASTTLLTFATAYGDLAGTASGNLVSANIDTIAKLNAYLNGQTLASTTASNQYFINDAGYLTSSALTPYLLQAYASSTYAIAGGAYHDGFSDFVANEHIDWTTDQGATNIHSGNYTDTNTNASTECSGTTTYLDGEGNCDNIASVYANLTGDTFTGTTTHTALTSSGGMDIVFDFTGTTTPNLCLGACY